MRYFKDSMLDVNPRARFWISQAVSHKYHRRTSFSFVRPLYFWRKRALVPWNVWEYHYNALMEGISMYVPKAKKIGLWAEIVLLSLGFLVGTFCYHLESRHWKEKKWDEEPGCVIPFRKVTMTRMYNWVVNYNLKPFLYYIGLFVEDKDIETHVDLQQFVQGRKYRRYLVAEYARRSIYERKRDSRYDFIEVSPMYGKDNL